MGDLKASFAPTHDNILFGVKGSYKFPNKRPKDVISVQRVSPNRLVHPNEKPVELLKYLVESTTKTGDTVLDCFMGSGTTGIACVESNRKFIGIELDRDYFNISKERIEDAACDAS